jgi:BON domain-containing protein
MCCASNRQRRKSMLKRRASFGERIGHFFTLLGAIGLGAGLAYILDPQQGGTRRAWVRDKMNGGLRHSGRFLDKRVRDLRNRVQGRVAEIRASATEQQIDDDVLAERVRAQLGHVLSHPGSIDIIAQNGVVTVRGPVLEGEAEKIRERLSETRGVQDFRIEVATHPSAEGIAGLQGESRSQRRARGGK